MFALSSSPAMRAAPASSSSSKKGSCSSSKSALLLARGGPLRHPRAVVTRASGNKEEALRALENFGAGVAARVAVVASASPSDLAAAPTAALSSADGGPGIRQLTAAEFWPTIREEAGDKLVVVDFFTQ
jgi:hypothetical protein